jgi:nitrogen-specific signal transduction histidine kinase
MCMEFFESGTCFRAELTIKNNTIVDISKGFCTMTGFSFSDFIEQSVTDAFITLKCSLKNFPSLSGTYHCYIFTKCLDAIDIELNIKNRSYDTKIITFTEKSFCRLSDRLSYATIMCKDNLSAIAIYSASDMILLKASEMYINYFYEDCTEVEYYIGKSFDDLIFELKDNIHKFIYGQQSKTYKTVLLKEFEIKTNKYGTTYWNTTITSISEYSEMKYIIVNCVNVTDKVLSRHNIEKQSKIINEQNQLLQRTLKEQEDFFSSMSHELKTPLNVIFSALQVLELYNASDKTAKYNKIMKQNCYRLLRLINNIVDMSKIDSGYFKLDLGNYNIIEIIEDIVLSVADFIEAKGLTLIFDTDVEEKILTCDPDKVERIILNLLSNAVKFTNPGGEIRVNIYDNIQYVNIIIEDTGIGIPEDKQDIIFERFKQVNKSLQRNHEGSGIGLSLVKSLVEMHGGSIKVHSALGNGSRFSILIPAKVIGTNPVNNTHDSISNNTERIHLEFSDIYTLSE